MKNRIFLIFSAFISLTSCVDSPSKSIEKEENTVPKTDVSASQTDILFSFSLYEPLDLIVSQGVYHVAYRNCQFLDTVSGNIGPALLSKDSLLYVRVVAASEEISGEGIYAGELTGLRLATPHHSEPINLSFFNPNFSAFCSQEQKIYYWGFEKEELFACSYDFRTRTYKRRYLSPVIETDFFGVYDVPVISGDSIRFSINWDESVWEIPLKSL